MARYFGTVAYFCMYKLAEAERGALEAAGIDKEMGLHTSCSPRSMARLSVRVLPQPWPGLRDNEPRLKSAWQRESSPNHFLCLIENSGPRWEVFLKFRVLDTSESAWVGNLTRPFLSPAHNEAGGTV